MGSIDPGDLSWGSVYGSQMGWLIDPNEQSVIVSRIDHNTEVIDDSQIILPVPGFAAAIELSIE